MNCIKLFIVFSFLLINSSIFAQNKEISHKRGLIIAIGNYPSELGWAKLSSLNDVGLIEGAMIQQGFLPENIIVVKDSEATKAGIDKAFEDFILTCNPGDYVFVHFSCHGQQISDDNGDEPDGFDEAMIPYDAPAPAFVSKNYKGGLHLRDDEIGKHINDIRKKVGSKGQVLLTLDACHSGTGMRDNDKYRGGMEPLIIESSNSPVANTKEPGIGMTESGIISTSGSAPYVCISACSFEERNKETFALIGEKMLGVGSLSIAISRVFSDIDPKYSYQDIFGLIERELMLEAPKQSPAIEGDIEYKIFNGETVKRKLFFEIEKAGTLNNYYINAGQAMNLNVGDSIGFFPVGTGDFKGISPIYTGVIVKIFPYTSLVKLPDGIIIKNIKDFWLQRTYYELNKPACFCFDDDIPDDIVKGAELRFEGNPAININDCSCNYMVEIPQDHRSSGSSDFNIINTFDSTVVAEIELNSRSEANSGIEEAIASIAQGDFLRNLQFADSAYIVEIEFVTVKGEYNDEGNVLSLTENNNAKSINYNGIIKVGLNDEVGIRVTNKGPNDAYYAIIEIAPNGIVSPVVPCEESPNAKEFFIKAGETKLLQEVAFTGFSPPLGKEVFKVFCGPQPINIGPIVMTRDAVDTRDASVIESVLSSSYFGISTRTGNKKTAVTHNDNTGSTFDYIITIVE